MNAVISTKGQVVLPVAVRKALGLKPGMRVEIRVEVYFDDDTPAQEARVVLLEGDRIVASGKTDERGVWNCPKPAPGLYSIKVESTGHAATESISIEPSAIDSRQSNEDSAQDREAKTRTPWIRLVLGWGVIGGLAIAWWGGRKLIHRLLKQRLEIRREAIERGQ